MAADFFVGDEVFEIGDAADDGTHDNGKGGDADDLIVVIVVEGEEHVVEWGSDEIVEPLARYFPVIFTATGELY